MQLTPKFREEYITAIESFVTHHLTESGRSRLVVGISGGLDSAVVARLCAKAVGPTKVIGMMLLDEATNPMDIEDAREWARSLKIHFKEIDISPIVESFRTSLGLKKSDKNAIGNVKARCRMIIIYNNAAMEDGLVIGTSNKSELLCGYFTKFGDGGADFLPIGDLYKTQVRQLARSLGVPRRILEKAPTAGLWKGQTDESELGIKYEELDRILLGIELQLEPRDIARKTGLSPAKIAKVQQLVEKSIHKRKIPLIPKLGIRTVGLDWRE